MRKWVRVLSYTVLGLWLATGLAVPVRAQVLRMKVSVGPDAPQPQRAAAASVEANHLIVQFSAPPEAAQRDRLQELGAVLLQDVPDWALLIAVDPAVGARWNGGDLEPSLARELGELGVVLVRPMDAREKISPLVSAAMQAGPGPDTERRNPRRSAAVPSLDPDIEHYVVEFHPDVDLGFARSLVLNAGLELRENPDLGANRLMVRDTAANREGAEFAALMALAARDEVAYIFPASEELIAGIPVDRCYSGLTQTGFIGQFITTYGNGWDGTGQNAATIGYFYDSRTPDLSNSAQEAEILRAMLEWSSVADLTWTPGANNATKSVDILFGAGEHGDGFPFDGPSGVLGHTFFPAPPNPETIAGDMHFDEAETWRIGAHYDLYSVALHELGHALGLGHSDDPTAVMYPYYSMYTVLKNDDRNAILTLYAAAGPPPPPGPAADSVAPSSGSASLQTFTFELSHPSGASNITLAEVLFTAGASTSQSNACRIVYSRAAGTIGLYNDANSSASSKPLGSSANLQNTQCAVGYAAAVTAGNTLTLQVQVLFKTVYAGAKNTFLKGADANSSSGWTSVGTWTVPGTAPTADSVAPASGASYLQTFTFAMSHGWGAANVTAAEILFTAGASTNQTNACRIVFNRAAGTIGLYNNTNSSTSSKVMGSSANLQNSQCAVGYAAASASGDTLTLQVQVLFKSPYAGVKNTYLKALAAAADSGWSSVGTWTVPGAPPSANAVSPNSGSGSLQMFTFDLSDTSGTASIEGAQVLATVGASSNQASACLIAYDRAAGTIGLYNDAATLLSTKPLGSSANLQNTQCAVGYAGASTSGNSLTLLVQILFKEPAFSGTKAMYLQAVGGGGSSGWVSVGSWTVGGAPPTAVSVTPGSGGGTLQFFTLNLSDTASATTIAGAQVLFTPGVATDQASACRVFYDRTTATVGLWDDAGTTLNSKPAGSSANLQNSQCAVGYAGMTTSGNTMSVQVQILFKSPAFIGTKNTFLQALGSAANSAWSFMGQWTVP